MGFPLFVITLDSVITTYAVAHIGRTPLVRSRPAYIFAAAWLLQSFVWALWITIVYPKYLSPLRHLPGPAGGHWLLGQWKRIAREGNGAPMKEWIDTIPNEGIIRYLGLFNQEVLLITSPKALSDVLVTHSYDFVKAPEVRWSLSRVLGFGMLLAEGDEHKRQRRDLMPAFAFRHLKTLYPIIWAKACETVRVMTDQVCQTTAGPTVVVPTTIESTGSTDHPLRGSLEAYSWASRATLDLIGLAGMGRDFQAVQDPNNHLSRTYQHLLRGSNQTYIFVLLLMVLPEWLIGALPIKRNDEVRQANRVFRETYRSLIREKKERLAHRRQQQQQQQQRPRQQSETEKKTMGQEKEAVDACDILSVAIESGGFTDDELVGQMMTFMAAGHETTAAALVWGVYEMCKHRDVQDRLRAEVRSRLPPADVSASGAAITAQDLDGLPYLGAVCSEVLRYHTPVPTTLRVAARETTIQGVRVAAGQRVVMSSTATNRDAAQWGPSADRFDPDRWLNSTGESKGAAASGGAASNYSYMTFIHGPRSCIGANFARAEMAALLAAWVGRFELELEDGRDADERNLDMKKGVTQRPRGLRVRLRVIEGW